MTDKNDEILLDDIVAESQAPMLAEQPKESATLSISLTPAKLFLGGFIAGLLVMAVPTTYFATASGGANNRALANNTIPSAPTPSDQGAPQAPTVGTVKPVSNDDHYTGAKNAEVVLIEYSDTECPFCKRFHPSMLQLMKEYNGKVAWVWRHFPLSFHPNAQKEAEATECAAEIGGNDVFWKYLNTVMERTEAGGTGFALDKLVPLAKELGLNEAKFKECLDTGKFAEKVAKDMKEGQAAGVDGTPGTILIAKDGRKALVPGAVPYEELKREVDALLK